MKEIIDIYGEAILVLLGLLAAALLVGGIFVIFKTAVIEILSRLFIFCLYSVDFKENLL